MFAGGFGAVGKHGVEMGALFVLSFMLLGGCSTPPDKPATRAPAVGTSAPVPAPKHPKPAVPDRYAQAKVTITALLQKIRDEHIDVVDGLALSGGCIQSMLQGAGIADPAASLEGASAVNAMDRISGAMDHVARVGTGDISSSELTALCATGMLAPQTLSSSFIDREELDWLAGKSAEMAGIGVELAKEKLWSYAQVVRPIPGAPASRAGMHAEDSKTEPLSPVLQEIIAGIKARHSGAEGRARAALDFVQNDIRYVALAMGEGSHRPSHPNEVIVRRFGDCKDKTVLLLAMPHEMGITADAALVSYRNRRAVEQWLPSPSYFDHVIVRAQFDGKAVWLDGTRTYQKGPLARCAIAPFGRALIVSPHTTGLTPVTFPSEYRTGSVRRQEFTLRKLSDNAQLSTESTYEGDEAEFTRSIIATHGRHAHATAHAHRDTVLQILQPIESGRHPPHHGVRLSLADRFRSG